MRIGIKMSEAVEYVANHPGCAKLPVAEAVGPHGSRRYGYQIVNRAIRSGLLIATMTSSGSYSLEVRDEC